MSRSLHTYIDKDHQHGSGLGYLQFYASRQKLVAMVASAHANVRNN